MKIKGKRPGVHVEDVILPRNGDDIILRMRAIEDFSEFEKLCPEPEPPARIKPGGQKISNFADENYLKEMEAYGGKRVAFMVIKGLLTGSDDVEFEEVKLEDHTTWPNFRKELRESGLSDVEVNRIVSGAMRANSLSESAVEEARKRFLASVQVQAEE